MAERQGYENNDFTGGITDEYVPAKDNRLDAAQNICLDDDLTPIQRPGSAPLGGSNAVYGIIDSQKNDPIKGLIENTKKLFAFTANRTAHYDKISETTFVDQTPASGTIDYITFVPTPDPNPTAFNTAVDYQNHGTQAHVAPTPVMGGSINHFQARDIVYATSSKNSYPQKYFKDDIRGDSGFGAGLPFLPTMHRPDFTLAFIPLPEMEVGLYRTQGLENPVTIAEQDAAFTPKLMPNDTNTYAWSDKPYTYDNGVIIKSNFAFKYQFCFVLRIRYMVDGVLYEKRSAPSPVYWFLTDFELKSTFTGVAPNRTKTTYYMGATYNLNALHSQLRSMNLPFFDPGIDPNIFFVDDKKVIIGIETYMTENNGTSFTTRKEYQPGLVNGVLTYNLANFYRRINANMGPLSKGANFIAPENTSINFRPDIVVVHERGEADTDFVSLYTQNGILPNDPPPPSKYIFYAGTYAFYLNIKELSEQFNASISRYEYTWASVPYRLKIANANDPDSVPEGNLVDLPDSLSGGGSVLDRAIVGTTKEIYRIDGRYAPDGTGLVNGQLLSSETGILSHKSIVSVKDKIFFCGDDGIYMTDGVAVICISRHLSRTYRKLIMSVASDTTGEYIQIDREAAQTNISAIYDRVYDRILFSFGSKVLALELKASRLDEAYGAFYGPWISSQNENFEAFTSLGIYKDMVVRGDTFGYVYQMSPGYLSDPISSDATLPPQTGLLPIIYRLRTAKMALGSLVVKKWVNYVTFILKRRKVLTGGQTDIDVQVNAYNDGERIRQTLKPAHYAGQRDNVFDENPKVGVNAVPFDGTDTLVNFQRRFGSSGLRCLTKAVEFTNGLHLVGKSDDFEQSLNSGVFVSLPNHPTFQWPKDPQDSSQVGYLISFAADNYETKYVIQSATTATLTLLTNPPAGLQKWKLYSFSTKQFFGLHSLGLVYTTFASKHSDYLISEQGGNAGDTGE